MKDINKIIAVFIVGIIIICGTIITTNKTDESLGGLVNVGKKIFVSGLWAGSPAVQVADSSGNLIGPISSSNNLTITGTSDLAATTITGLTADGTNTMSGATTFTNTTLINESASSTLVIGQTANTNDTGCLKMWDQNASSTPYYIYIDSSIGTSPTYGLVATSTQPAFCR